MFKRAVCLFLLICVIASSFSRFFTYAGFEVNKKYIAERLCENKSRPWLHCNGHCYLMKKLKLAEEKEKKQEQEAKRSQYQEALAPETALTLDMQPKVTHYPAFRSSGPVTRALPIFQPPQLT